ncbi:MAG: carboxypeptidase-like regulatory domain-containing protein [Terracidiphilus sp.]
MRSLIFLFVAFCLTPPVVSAQPEVLKPGAVAGHVYCSDMNRPCRFAEVNIHRVQADFHANKTGGTSFTPDKNAHSATTGIDGGFLITGVPPGDYYVRSHFAGYLDPFQVVFSETEAEETIPSEDLEKVLPRITVSAGMTTSSDLTLSRGASLEGTVRYDDGAPAGFVNFCLYRKSTTGKWNKFGDSLVAGYRMTSFARTDDRGRFYFPGLPSGFYIVEASLPQTRIIPGIGAGFSSNGADSLRVFNGDKYRMKDAPPIELKDGEDNHGIDIVIPTNGLLALQGFIIAKADGHSLSKGTVSLLDPDDKTILREADIQKDGFFAFNYVTSGNYLVQVEAQANAGELPYESLSVPLRVGSDMPDLTFAVSTKNR